MPEQTSGPSWTPEDVELVGVAIDEYYRNLGMPDVPRPYAAAEAVLAALAEAGQLTPNGTTEQFGVGGYGRRVVAYTTEAVARRKATEFRLPLFRRWVGPWLPVDAGDMADPSFCSRCGHACAHSPRHPLAETEAGLVCEDTASCAGRSNSDARRCQDCGEARGANANTGCEACAEHVVEGADQP